MLVLNALTPVFLLVVLGMWLQRSSFVSAGFLREANRVTYWLGLPALLFSQLVSSLHDAAGAERLVGAMFLTTALAVLVGYLVAWLLRVPGPVTGTFVLTVSQHTFGPKMIWPILKQLAVTPPLLATLAGIGFVAMGWTLPRSIAHTLEALGEMALPLGLLGVGGSLITAKLSGAWRAPLASALLKSVAGPLLAYAAARWFGLGVRETVMIMILAAAPTAIVSYTMAVEMKGDEKLASATIALSVVTSLVALAVVVSLFPV